MNRTKKQRELVIIEKIVESKNGKDFIPTKEEIKNSDCFVKQIETEQGIATVGFKNNKPVIVEKYSKSQDIFKTITDEETISKMLKNIKFD